MVNILTNIERLGCIDNCSLKRFELSQDIGYVHHIAFCYLKKAKLLIFPYRNHMKNKKLNTDKKSNVKQLLQTIILIGS